MHMAKKSEGLNVSAAVRAFRKSHPGATARAAFEAIQKANPKEKFNENSLKTTFYKLAGAGKKKTVKRRKPGRVVEHGSEEHIMKAGLNFIYLAGGVENARERLVGLAEMIEMFESVTAVE